MTTKVGRRVARKKAEVRTDENGNLVPGPSGLVSYPEMIVLFNVAEVTPHTWRARVETTRFPEPHDTVGGLPLWKVADLYRWGQQTGRPVYLAPEWVEQLGLPPANLPPPAPKPATPNVDPDDLRRWYVDEKLSLERIADRVGVTGKTVAQWLRNAGVEIRPPGAHVARQEQ